MGWISMSRERRLDLARSFKARVSVGENSPSATVERGFQSSLTDEGSLVLHAYPALKDRAKLKSPRRGGSIREL